MNKKYAICYNPSLKGSEEVKNFLEESLSKKNIDTCILTIDEMEQNFDFVFVIGGDGTILKASRYYSKTQTPILGINLGHLGFLSQISKNEIETCIDKIIKKDYRIEKRMMLEFENYVALNDFVIKGNDLSRVSKFALEINGKFVCEYVADGIIISTPTGSTAYNMAAGGPIISPKLDAIVIVPICPHTFSTRPIVVSSEDVIKILQSKTNKNYIVSADGQEVFKISHEIEVKKSQYCANLVVLNNNDFYSILRNKLYWGQTPAYEK